MEQGWELMTLKSKSKVCRLNKKSRMEQGYAKLILKSKSKLYRLRKKEQNGAGMRTNDPKG